MLVEEQISARQQRARSAIRSILTKPPGHGYGDYEVRSASGRRYRVAMRSPSLFENYCSCADFAVNTLGTCKHIEALLIRLRRRFGRSFDRQRYERTRASLSLHYGETLNVRIRLAVDTSPALQKIAAEHFDSEVFLRKEHLCKFEELLEKLRAADETVIVYTDVLDFIDRENDLAPGLENELRSLAQLEKRKNPLEGLLKTPLFPYQIRGALFAACLPRVRPSQSFSKRAWISWKRSLHQQRALPQLRFNQEPLSALFLLSCGLTRRPNALFSPFPCRNP